MKLRTAAWTLAAIAVVAAGTIPLVAQPTGEGPDTAPPREGRPPGPPRDRPRGEGAQGDSPRDQGPGDSNPRDGNPRDQGRRPPPPPHPLETALDADHDGEISTAEMENATAVLKKLDADGDGKLTPDEYRPKRPPGPPGGPRPGGDRQRPAGERQRPANRDRRGPDRGDPNERGPRQPPQPDDDADARPRPEDKAASPFDEYGPPRFDRHPPPPGPPHFGPPGPDEDCERGYAAREPGDHFPPPRGPHRPEFGRVDARMAFRSPPPERDRPTREEIFELLDRDEDGRLSAEEFVGRRAYRPEY